MNQPRAALTPCTELCELDPRTGLCRGCLRTLDEICRWPQMTEAERRDVMAQLALRQSNGTVTGSAP